MDNYNKLMGAIVAVGAVGILSAAGLVYHLYSHPKHENQNLPAINLAEEVQTTPNANLEGKVANNSNLVYTPSEKPTIQPNQNQGAAEQAPVTATAQTAKPYMPSQEEVAQNAEVFRNFFFAPNVSADIALLHQAFNRPYLPNSQVRVSGYALKGELNPELLTVTGATDNNAFKEGLLNILKKYNMPSGAFDIDFQFTSHGGKK